MKENIDKISYLPLLHFLFGSWFLSELKEADIKPVYKKEDNYLKENHRPVSILPNFYKIYERLMYSTRYMHTLKQYYLMFDAVFDEDTVCNIA